MARLLLFAQAREAAGTRETNIDASSVSQLVSKAIAAYPALGAVVPLCSVMVNGKLVRELASTSVDTDSEVALLPPVSGG